MNYNQQAPRPAQINDIMSFTQVPVPNKNRQCTDIFCTVCTAIFALTLFIICCVIFNNDNLKKMTYLTDGQGKTCATQLKQTFPIVYFTSFSDPSKRLCVSKCPTQNDTKLSCFPTYNLSCSANSNKQHQVIVYNSFMKLNRIGLLCLPYDKDLRNTILQNSDMLDRYQFLEIYDSIWTSLWISIVFGIILILLIQFIPRQIVHWMILLGGLALVALGIVIFIVPSGFILWKIIGGIGLLLLGSLLLITVFYSDYRKEIFVCGRLIQIASLIVKQNWQVLIFILVWWILQCGLIALTAFQLLSAWSFGDLIFAPENPFHKVNGGFLTNLLSFLIFVQFIWGLSFLKEAFNFCVSGFATQWYCFKKQASLMAPLKRLLRYHWGSVVGGSLLLIVFYFLDLFTDFYQNSRTFEDRHNRSEVEKKAEYHRKTLERRGVCSILDLVRSQSFGYINLIPIPYCNASRYCEMLDQDTNFYDRSQTSNRLYRLSAHVLIMTIANLIAFGYNNHTDSAPNIWGILFVSLVSLFSVTYFVALHGDLAEGVYISTIVEERLRHLEAKIYDLPSEVNENYAKNTLFVAPVVVKDLYVDDLLNSYQHTTIGEYLLAKNESENTYGYPTNFLPDTLSKYLPDQLLEPKQPKMI